MDQISQIKQKLDIVTLVGTYVSLKKSGNSYKGLCPFHSEKSPSFMVSPELQIFKCFGCFPTGSPVQTPDGLKNIEEIRKGDLVISGKGLSRKVLLTYERLFKGLLITAKVRMLGGNIAFTDDHNVFTLGQGYTTSYKYLSKRLKKYDKALPEKRKLSSAKYFPIRKVKAGELKLGQALLYPIKQGNKDIVSLDLKKYYTKILPNHGTKPRKIHQGVSCDSDLVSLESKIIRSRPITA